jgi:hypothetical protein
MMAALSGRQHLTLLLLSLALLLFSALRFSGPARGYWDTYITVPAMFMTGQRVDLQRIDGSPRFDYELADRIPASTFDPSPGGFGIASKDQRIGAAVLFGAPFSLFNMATFRWGYAGIWVLAFLFGFLALRALLRPEETSAPQPGRDFAVPLAGALVLVLNPFSLTLDRLNGNLFGLAILTCLFFLMSERRPTWWLIGMVYGILGGIRNEAIILGPMMLAFLWRRAPEPRAFARSLAVFTATAAVAITPVLLWNRFAYGQMIIHPSQVAHLQGFRPTFEHSLFGAAFEFNGLLNVPFHDHLVRTPHFAYPTFLLWPLITIKSLGLALAGLAPVGVVELWRRRRFEAGVLLFWYGVFFVLFAPQENWEELKQTFMALHLFPLVAFVSAGLAWLLARLRSPRAWGVLGALVVGLGLFVFSARWVDAPADERWYVRFPHAGRNDAGLEELPEARRKDWEYFYTRETESEIARERVDLASPSPLPALYRPLEWPSAATLTRLAEEPFQRELSALAVWSYIYE